MSFYIVDILLLAFIECYMCIVCILRRASYEIKAIDCAVSNIISFKMALQSYLSFGRTVRRHCFVVFCYCNRHR